MPINLYHTQRIRGFQQLKENYSSKSLTVKLKRTKFNCRKCGSESLTATAIRQRKVSGQPMGNAAKLFLSSQSTGFTVKIANIVQ